MTAFENIIIAIIAFSLVGAMLNASGVFGDGKLPTQDDTMRLNSTAEIEELTASPKASSGVDFIDSFTGGIKLIMKTLGFLKQLIFTTLNFPGLLASYGVPSYVSTPIYAMMLLSAFFMLMKWMAQRQ